MIPINGMRMDHQSVSAFSRSSRQPPGLEDCHRQYRHTCRMARWRSGALSGNPRFTRQSGHRTLVNGSFPSARKRKSSGGTSTRRRSHKRRRHKKKRPNQTIEPFLRKVSYSRNNASIFSPGFAESPAGGGGLLPGSGARVRGSGQFRGPHPQASRLHSPAGQSDEPALHAAWRSVRTAI